MNFKRKVLGGFSHTADDELLVRGATVLQAMTDNPLFTDPVPAYADLATAWQDYQEKLAISRLRGSPMDTAAKASSKIKLAELLQQLAFYVNRVANGNLVSLLSSGFELNSFPGRGMVPDMIRYVRLRDGYQERQMRLDFKPQRNVLLYEYCYTRIRNSDGSLDWGERYTSSSSRGIIIYPLKSLQRYYVRVRALNTHGKSLWSEPVSHIVR